MLSVLTWNWASMQILKKPLFRSQDSENLVEYEQGFDMKIGKLILDTAEPNRNSDDKKTYVEVNNLPENQDGTRLKELSLMNNTYFGAIQYDIFLDVKLNYTISRVFQQMSFSELEALHHLCELERLQIIQHFASAKLKTPYAGYLLAGNRSNFIEYEGNIFRDCTCTEKKSLTTLFFEDKFSGYSCTLWIWKQA